MATKKYNPYNAVKSIAEQKDGWYQAKASGGDTSPYQKAALPYYQELENNGYGEYAKALMGSNGIHSWELLSEWGLKPDDEFEVDNAYNSVTGANGGGNAGNAGNGAAGVFDPSAQAYGTDPSTQRLLDMATGAGEGYQDFMNQTRGLATGQVSTQPSQTVDNMLNAWQSGNDRLNGAIQYDRNGNVISGLNTEHYNIGRNQLDYLNNFDVTKQPYYQGIMDQYKLGGANAANNAYASGAANNGGNIDSYAAANANRQQLAFTTAGQQAALAAAQQNQQNWQTLYSQMSQDLNNQGVLNANTLQQAAQMYQIDANERMNALDVAGALEQQAMANAINGYITNVQADMQKYGIDAETAMNRENNKAAYEQILAQLASQERINTENNETTRLGYASQERMNDTNNQTQRYGYDTERDIAGINRDTQLGVAGINRDSALGVAGINANTALTTAQLQNELNRYLGDLGYKQAIEGYKNAYDIASAENQTQLGLQKLLGKQQSELSAQEAQQQKDLYTWLNSMGLTTDSKGNIVSDANSGGQTKTGSSASIQQAVSRANEIWNMYIHKTDSSLQSPTDMYSAIAGIYPDTTSKEYAEAVAYIDNMLKVNKNYGNGIMSFNFES